MRTTSLRRSALAGVGACAIALGGGAAVLASRDGAPSRPPAPPVRSASASGVAAAQELVRRAPRSATALSQLAEAALVEARERGDLSWYGVADRAARTALAVDPRRVEALDALGSLALNRHRFREALGWSERSASVAPTRFAPLAIRADALVELGRYREGFAAVERRLSLRPDLSSYSRASYERELLGDRPGAIQLMRLAAESGRPGGEPRTWSRIQLGLLRLGSGDLAGAEAEMRRALAERPVDGRAIAGLARVRAAAGDLGEARTLYDRAIDLLPLPEHAAALGDIAAATGDRGLARESDALLDGMSALLRAGGVRADLDLALINADRRRPTSADVARARRAHRERPGIIGDDILGWVLTRSGRCAEGLRYGRRALRLGTRDPLMMFHVGMAAACAGRTGEARGHLRAALSLNPAFSVRWSPVARSTLARLEGPGAVGTQRATP